MTRFEVLLLGTGAALPDRGRHPSAQVLRYEECYYLIDCGEGTQMRLSDCKAPKQKLNQIFISHLHGDHVYGLIGLLTSYTLFNRQTPLDIYAPEGLEEMIAVQLRWSQCALSYPITYHVVDTERHYLLFEDRYLQVYSLPLSHRIPTSGFLFCEKPRPLNIRAEKIEEYGLDFTQIKQAKSGQDVLLSDGRLIPHTELTHPPAPQRRYAYCSDTAFDERLPGLIQGVDLLYHESTFDNSHELEASISRHSTAAQAAEIARRADAKQLLLGHFSPRYPDEGLLEAEARVVFRDSKAGREGRWYPVGGGEGVRG